jgi:hypothetical protein
MDRTIQLKNTVEDSHANSIKRYTENYTIIREMLSEMSIAKIEKLDNIKDKIMENLLTMQDYYGNATRDILEGIILITSSAEYDFRNEEEYRFFT